MRILLLLFIMTLLWPACKDAAPSPRPRAYPRVEYPKRNYVIFDRSECPFTLEYPGYGQVIDKDSTCWFDLYFPDFNARLHCSYIPLGDRNEYDDLVRDAFIIANKINERANYMEETRLRNPHGTGGILLTWTGPAASPVHFFLSDTTSHFFKGALYFDAKVQPDSLAPISAFIKEDINHLISSFKWK